MLKFAKIINEETKLCEVGLGTNIEFYKSIGMEEMEVEQAYDGTWYIEGFAPVQPIDEYNAEQKEKRSQAYIDRTDPLSLRKLRKLALGEWTSEDEKDYIYQMQKISEEINKEFTYIVDNNDSTVENTDNTLIFEDAK